MCLLYPEVSRVAVLGQLARTKDALDDRSNSTCLALIAAASLSYSQRARSQEIASKTNYFT